MASGLSQYGCHRAGRQSRPKPEDDQCTFDHQSYLLGFC
jgi:hypothetical protein